MWLVCSAAPVLSDGVSLSLASSINLTGMLVVSAVPAELRLQAPGAVAPGVCIGLSECVVTSMTPQQIHAQPDRCRPRPGPGQEVPWEGVFPLHRLPSICCSTGACRDVTYWPMAGPQDGWLQLGQDPHSAEPVELVGFSNRGVTVVLPAAMPLQQGLMGVLSTQAHGAGLSHRLVRCCWHRSHPQDHDRQLAGLRFVVNEQP